MEWREAEMKGEKTMKVFISQPMNGRTDEEIKAERKTITDAIKAEYGEDTEIIDSFFEGAPHDAKPVWFLGKSLEKLSTADAAFFADGWQNKKGCYIEHKVCELYGIEIVRD